MSHELDPKVGRWYRRLDDERVFKVATIDEDDGTVGIVAADGETEELDSTEWVELDLEAAEAPEDYVEPDDDDDDDDNKADVDEDDETTTTIGMTTTDDDGDDEDSDR